jgi:predicted double-glycine peptidase
VPLRIERTPIEGATADYLAPLGLDASVACDWARFAAPQVRNLLVARAGSEIAGVAITTSRPLASYLKVGGSWASDAETGAGLARAAEELAWETGCVVVKREARAGEPERGCFGPQNGYVQVLAPRIGAPIPDPGPGVPSAWFKWRSPGAVPEVPYMRQTTDFTCGTASLSMLLARSGVIDAPTRDLELALWRQATTISACDPYGLALTASRQGMTPRLFVSTTEALFLEELTTEQDRDLRRFIQDGFRDEAARAGIEAELRAFDVAELRDVLAAGGSAIVLVDELLVHGDKCPHWIVVHGLVGEHFLAHDPWTEHGQGESWVDGYHLPLAAEALDKIAWTGEPPARAMLVFPA